MTKIVRPYEMFNHHDGMPLEMGKIYIGEAGKNPETNPIKVYWDEGFKIDAVQPIRTIGGFPSRNGSAVDIFVNVSEYSITVRDKNDRLIYSKSTSDGVDPTIFRRFEDLLASQEGPRGVGELWEVGDFIYEELAPTDPNWSFITAGGVRLYLSPDNDGFIIPELFQAAGDGVTDDCLALQRWADWGNAEEAEIHGKPRSTYAFSKGVWFGNQDTLNGMDGLDGRMCSFKPLENGQRGLDFTGVNNGRRCVLQNFRVDPDDDNVTPLYAWAIGRPKQAAGSPVPFRSSGNIRFFNISTRGRYHIANTYMVSSESNSIDHCFNFQEGSCGHAEAYTDKHYFKDTVYLEMTSAAGGFVGNETVSNGSGATARIIRRPWAEEGKAGFRAIMTSAAEFNTGDTVTGGTSGATGTITNSPYVIGEFTFSPDGTEEGTTSTLLTITESYPNITNTESREEVVFISDFSDIFFGGGCNKNHQNRPTATKAGGVLVHMQTDRTRDPITAGSILQGIIFKGQYNHAGNGGNVTFGDNVTGGGIYRGIEFGDNLSSGAYNTAVVDSLDRIRYVGGEAQNALMSNTDIDTDFTVDLRGNLTVQRSVEIELASRTGLNSRFLYRGSQSMRALLKCSADVAIGDFDGAGNIVKPNTGSDHLQVIFNAGELPATIATGNVAGATGNASNVRGFGFNSVKNGTGDYELTTLHGGKDLRCHIELIQAGGARTSRVTQVDSRTLRVQTYRDGVATDCSFIVDMKA